MRSAVVHVVHRAPDSGARPLVSAGVIGRRKADERGCSRRDILVTDSAILLRRAHDVAGVPMLRTAACVGVSQQVASRWITEPLDRPPPLYSVGHPLVKLVVGATYAAQAADALALSESLDGDPAALHHALASLLHAVTTLQAMLVRGIR